MTQLQSWVIKYGLIFCEQHLNNNSCLGQLQNVSKLQLVMLQGAKKDMYMHVTASIKCSYPLIFSVVIIGSLSNNFLSDTRQQEVKHFPF